MTATDHRTSSSERTFAGALDRLRGAQKSGKGAPPYSLYVNRPAGRVVAAAAYRLGLTPNQVTAISACFSALGIALIAVGSLSWTTGLLGSMLLALGYAFDSADGQLARLRGGGSKSGEWLDHIIDSAKVSALHLAVVVSALRHSDAFPGPWWIAVPMVFTLVSSVHFFGMILHELLQREHRAKLGQVAPPQAASRMRTLLKAPTDYGVLCWVFVLFGLPTAFAGVYTFLAVASLGYLLLVLRKWFGDIRALDSETIA